MRWDEDAGRWVQDDAGEEPGGGGDDRPVPWARWEEPGVAVLADQTRLRPVSRDAARRAAVGAGRAAAGTVPPVRWRVPAGPVRVVLLLVAAIALLLVGRALGGGADVETLGPVSSAGGAASTASDHPAPSDTETAPTGAGATSATGQVVVDVVGQVRRPGVVRLPVGSRVQDAIRAAGGATRAADLARVNLARPLVDGEQIQVPRPGEALAAAPVPAGGSGGSAAASGSPVDLNSADASALDALPGIGPVLAERIVGWRTEHGRFSSVDELGEVSGIGESLLGRLRRLVRV